MDGYVKVSPLLNFGFELLSVLCIVFVQNIIDYADFRNKDCRPFSTLAFDKSRGPLCFWSSYVLLR